MLAFIAPDQNMISGLYEEVKRYLAWKSIKADSTDLNLDAAQNRETENNLVRSNQTVDSRIQETYAYLLVPYIDREVDLKTVVWDAISIRGGTDSLFVKAARKMQQNMQLITQWAPSMLLMELDKLLWKEKNELGISDLWKMLCTYCYLPRLAAYDVLEQAIQTGVNSDEYFGYAEGVSDGRYLGLKFNQYIGFVDKQGYLVKQVAALKQKAAEVQKPVIPPAGAPVAPVVGGSGSGSAILPVGGDVPAMPDEPKVNMNKHFYLSASIDTTRVNRDVSRLMDEVINHIM
jgi:hypothetical protein